MLHRTVFAIVVIVITSGCVQDELETVADLTPARIAAPAPPCAGCEPMAAEPDPVYSLRISDCKVIAHTLNVPAVVFQPEYLTGTRPADPNQATGYLGALLCDQATDDVETASPFHIAFFGASIDPPGPSAAQSTSALVGFEVVSNHAKLMQRMDDAGWKARVGGKFSLETDASPSAESTHYRFTVPGDNPAFTFEGLIATRTTNPAAETYNFVYYTRTGKGLVATTADYQGFRAGNSQPALATFAESTYWSSAANAPSWEAINARRYDVSGTITIEGIPEF